MKPDITPTERELLEIQKQLVRQIIEAQVIFGTEGNELRTTNAALEAIKERLKAARNERKQQSH